MTESDYMKGQASIDEPKDAPSFSSLTVTLTTAQEKLLLDYSEMGVLKLCNEDIIYVNDRMLKLCNFDCIDSLLHKNCRDLFSESSYTNFKKWQEKNTVLPALDTLEGIELSVDNGVYRVYVMPSFFHGKACIQLMFLSDKPVGQNIEEKNQENAKNSMVKELATALQNNKCRILFQPIACLTGSNEAHYDVMLRATVSDGMEISAGEFMGDLDRNALAVKIDKWVIIQAIKNLLVHQQEGKQAYLFIHLSSASVLDRSLPPWLYQIIKKSGINPSSLILQIAEQTVINFGKESKRLFNSAKNTGCRINICHFGIAENALDVLDEVGKEYCDYVKLHNTFTRGLVDNHNSEQDVRALVEALHARNLKTIIPHVETPNVMTQLWRCGVDYVQGYFLQRPRSRMDYDFSSE